MDTLVIYKALADEVRLRVLRAVGMAELSVAELVSILALPQSTVSRHLKPLRDSSLVDTRRDGTSVYYRLGPAFEDDTFSDLLSKQLKDVGSAEEDKLSVRRVLDERLKKSRTFFNNVAGSYSELNEPGGGWRALASAMAVGFTGKHIVDIGAGEGELSLMLARFAARVIAVDISPEMLNVIEEKAARQNLSDRISVAEGDLHHVPIPDKSADVVFLSQSLHHAAVPKQAVEEASRVLKPGGSLIILDLQSHQLEWVREQMADQWLGFKESDLMLWMHQADIRPITIKPLQSANPEFSVLLAYGIKEDDDS